MPTASTIASTSASSLAQPLCVDARAQPELDAELVQQPRLVGQRLVRLAVGRDRVADESADLLALVVHRHRVAACGELASRSQPGRAGADDRDAPAVGGQAAAQRVPFSKAQSVA